MSIRLRYDSDPATRVGQMLGDAFLVALIRVPREPDRRHPAVDAGPRVMASFTVARASEGPAE